MTPTPFPKVRADFSLVLLSWHKQNRSLHPWRIGKRSPYRVWVAEIMLQQTTIATVKDRYKAFIEEFPDLRTLARSSPEKLISAVRGLGYYNRFYRMKCCAEILVERGGVFPQSYSELLTLPGLGPYTAAAIASICFREAVPTVDGNVKRVMSRVLDLRVPVSDSRLGKPLFNELKTLICQQQPGGFNEALMELGQTLCTPNLQKSTCNLCPIKQSCHSFQNSTQHLCPAPSKSTPLLPLTISALIHTCSEKIRLSKRSKNAVVLKNTRGLPLTFAPTPHSTQNLKTHLLGHFSHRITRYKIQVYVYLYQDPNPKPSSSEWVLQELAPKQWISSLDHKAWKLYQEHLRNQ